MPSINFKRHGYFRLLIVSLLCASLFGCHSPRDATSGSVSHSTEMEPARYHEVSAAIWDDYKENTRFDARIFTLIPRLIDAPDNVPISRLVITNLTTERTIFQRDMDFRPLGMHTERLFDNQLALVTEWAGGSADGIMIFSVSPLGGKVVLDEDYRIGASFIPGGGDTVDVFITSGCCGVGPFYTTRFVYNGQAYKPAGSMAFEDFTNVLNHAFANK